MLPVIAGTDRPVGIKPSGGIRTIADAALYLAIADDIMGPDWGLAGHVPVRRQRRARRGRRRPRRAGARAGRFIELLTPAVLPQEVIRLKRATVVSCRRRRSNSSSPASSAGPCPKGRRRHWRWRSSSEGMVLDERVALTLAMTRSGVVLSWDDLDGPVVDKHSTGGVGDTVSLMLAPAVAVCGAFVPMISGAAWATPAGRSTRCSRSRGTTRTPDRGYVPRASRATSAARSSVRPTTWRPPTSGSTRIRDVTATVESVPLITASILSKKLAAGLDGLAMDVKFGNGAFMSSREKAAISPP